MIPKEEQPTRYYYRVIKDNSLSVGENKFQDFETNEIVFTTEPEKFENPDFKFLFKFRPAFIGDMQAKLDEAYGFSNLEHYLRTSSNQVEPVRYITNVVYERINIFQWLYMKAKEAIVNYELNRWMKKKKQKDEILDPEFLDMIYKHKERTEKDGSS